jgi:Protein of unknown function (DUF3570)
VRTASLQAAVVAAATEGLRHCLRSAARLVCAALLVAAGAHAEPSDQAILGPTSEGAQIDELRLRMTSFSQAGHGYQSVAGPLSGPGSERALILQPMALIGIRQSPRIHHEVVVPVDIVSAASVNAIDVLTHASGVNEAMGIDVTSRFEVSHEDQLVSRLAWHEEEPFGSGAFGLGYTRALADDNATLGISGQATFDRFDYLKRDGSRHGRRNRTTLNGNLSLSQLLSPTTVFDASYGLTFQQGMLQTTYDSVPLASGNARAAEIFPHSRTRHAVQARLAQHLPASHTTLRAAYRYYSDTFQLKAHSAEFELHQYLGPRFIARGSYRYYTQTGVDFFSTAFAFEGALPRTSDSDLAPFQAQELGLKLLWLARGQSTLDLSYSHYWRTNDLFANIISFGYGARF